MWCYATSSSKVLKYHKTDPLPKTEWLDQFLTFVLRWWRQYVALLGTIDPITRSHRKMRKYRVCSHRWRVYRGTPPNVWWLLRTTGSVWMYFSSSPQFYFFQIECSLLALTYSHEHRSSKMIHLSKIAKTFVSLPVSPSFHVFTPLLKYQFDWKIYLNNCWYHFQK